MRVDNWEVRVERIVVAEQMESSASRARIKAAGRFAVIFMSVMNRGLRPDTFVAFGILEIQDAGGTRSEEDFVASAYAQGKYGTDIGANINPDDTAHVVAVYDISRHSDVYRLVPGLLAREHSGSLPLNVP